MVLETAESFWNLVSKERFLKLKDFELKCSQFGNTCVWGYIFYDEASQIQKQKSNGRRKTGQLSTSCTTNTGIDEGTIVSKKPRPQVSHW